MVQLSELDRTIAELGQHGLAYLGHLGIEIGFVTRAAMQRGDGLHSVAILEKLCVSGYSRPQISRLVKRGSERRALV
jgi:hypothetical protein